MILRGSSSYMILRGSSIYTTAADDDCCKLLKLVADRRCRSELLHSSRSMETGGAES